MDRRLPRTDKLRDMVHRGIPHSLRPQIWMRMSGKEHQVLESIASNYLVWFQIMF